MTKIMLTSFELIPWDSNASHHEPNPSASSQWSRTLNYLQYRSMEYVIGAQNQSCPLAKNVCCSRKEHISNQQR